MTTFQMKTATIPIATLIVAIALPVEVRSTPCCQVDGLFHYRQCPNTVIVVVMIINVS